jgi:hypothetical protein
VSLPPRAASLELTESSGEIVACHKSRFRLTQFNRIGPVDLTSGTLSTGQLVPTVTDNLFSQGTITGNVVGISFEPTTTEDDVNGSLAFGGTDSTKFTGSIAFTAVTSTSPASEYWGINQSVTCTFNIFWGVLVRHDAFNLNRDRRLNQHSCLDRRYCRHRHHPHLPRHQRVHQVQERHRRCR